MDERGGVDARSGLGGLALVLGLIAAVVLGTVLLSGCESADRAAAQRASAEASLERARADTRLALNEQSHRFFQENMPIILIVAGGVVLVIIVAMMAWWMMREQEIRREAMARMPMQAQLPPPPVVIINQLPHESKGAAYRRMSRELEAGQRDEVVLYDRDGQY